MSTTKPIFIYIYSFIIFEHDIPTGECEVLGKEMTSILLVMCRPTSPGVLRICVSCDDVHNPSFTLSSSMSSYSL